MEEIRTIYRFANDMLTIESFTERSNKTRMSRYAEPYEKDRHEAGYIVDLRIGDSFGSANALDVYI